MPRRQCSNLPAPAREERIAADQERPCAQLGNGCKDRIEVAFGAGTQGMQLQRKLAGAFLQVSRLRLGIGAGAFCTIVILAQSEFNLVGSPLYAVALKRVS